MGRYAQGRNAMPSPDERRAPSLLEAAIPVASLILLVALSYYLFGDSGANGPNQVALIIATMIAVVLAWRRGHALGELGEAATTSVESGLGAIFILFAVGGLIGTWAMSGTLVAMVYYGLQILNPNYFYVTAAAICAVVSFGIGSSWTVAGTIGIGLMGISAYMGLDPAITAGAVISGAYFGDTTSPLSDSANLAAGVGGANLYDHIREVLPISAGALAISLGFFWLLGSPGTFDASDKMRGIGSAFHISLVLFLPLVVVVVMALLKIPPFTTIFTGALLGGLLAVIVAPERVLAFADPAHGVPAWLGLIKGVWQALASGYVSTTGQSSLDQLATRGGMSSMLSTIWLIIAAFAFGGIAEKTGVLERLISPIVSAARTTGRLIASVVVAVLGAGIATADQYLAIVLPGRMFKQSFTARGLGPTVLSRSVGASGTPTSALIPWNSCGAYLAVTLGVATLSYAPYAIFGIASPLLAIAAGYMGFRVLRSRPAPTDESGRLEGSAADKS